MVCTFILLTIPAGIPAQTAEPDIGEIVFQEKFDRPDALKGWSENNGTWLSADEGIAGSGCFQAAISPENSKSPDRMISIPLDLKIMKGRGIVLEGMLKGENIAVPGKKYLGPKLMIHVKSPYGESWLDQPKKYGSYDWQKFTLFARIPPDVEKLELSIGLQGCTGRLLVDNIKITLLPAVANYSPGAAGISSQPQKIPALRGVMSGSQMTEKDIRELAEIWHANLIRYQIGNSAKEDLTDCAKYAEWVNRKIEKMDEVIALCGKYGIKVLIDLHAGPATKQDVLLSNQLSWTIESQDTLVKVWEKIAAKYKDNPVIWGYDILNEPREDNYVYEPGGALDWNRLAERVAAAIRKIDPDKPFIVEPAQWGSPSGLHVFKPIPVKNIVYSVHFYEPGEFTHQGIYGHPDGVAYPGMISGKKWDKAMLRRKLQPVVDFQRQYKVPIYIGEFSAARWAPGAAQWLQDLIEIFEENGWDWTYHAFREFDGWSVEHSSDRTDNKIKSTTDRKDVLLKYLQLNNKSLSAADLPAAAAGKLEVGSDALPHVENISSLNGFKPAAAEYRIYVIGDSITRHGFNKETIEKLKWDHLAGMAASSENKDYAHLLAAMIADKLPGRKVRLFFGKGHDSAGALSGLGDAAIYLPHLIVVQLGEHAKPAGSHEKTRTDYNALLDALLKLNPRPLILCTGVWNPQLGRQTYSDWTADVENIQRETCRNKNIPFASVEKYALDRQCSGTGGSPGVKWHPNDQGMAGYAKELFVLFQKHYSWNL